jgi:transposase
MVYSKDLKTAAVQHYLKSNKKSFRASSKIFHCSPSILRKWAREYQANDNTFAETSQKPQVYKVTKAHTAFLSHQFGSKTLSSRALTIKLNSSFQTKLSHTTVYRTLLEQGLIVKTPKMPRVPELFLSKSRDIPLELQNFHEMVNKHNSWEIICVGETTLKVTHKKITVKYTGVFAMSSTGIVQYTIYEKGGSNKNRLIAFFKSLLETKNNHLIILNNTSTHKSVELQECITKNNKLMYTVPYEYKNQPIAGFFDQLQLKMPNVRDCTYEFFCEVVAETIAKLPPQLYSNLMHKAHLKKYDNNKNKSQKKPTNTDK